MVKRVRIWAVVCICVALAAPALASADDKKPFTARLAVKVYEGFLAIRGFSPDELSVHSIGHSHIDAAWKWRMAETHTKVHTTFAKAIGNMERRPHFTYSQSQPAFYEWVLQDDPELFARIVKMEAAGQWELVGGLWVEPDCNMPEGESFVRQRLLGQRFYLEHFGHVSKIAWLPDSFGYNRNLPQIFARSGARYLWAKKINTNGDTTFPFHNFIWRAPDGSEILVTLNQASVGLGFFCHQEVGKFKNARYLAPAGEKLEGDYTWTPEALQAALSDDWLNEIGNFYGEGDGDAGPMEIEIQIQEALAEKGYTKFNNAAGYLGTLEQYRNRLPVWNDELYMERHRGVQTTQAWIKRANRLAEQMMHSAETISFITGLYGNDYPAAALKRIWKMICMNQFHDILPGSSVPEVYEDARRDYKIIESETRTIIGGGMKALAERVEVAPPRAGLEPIMVFNSLAWKRSGLVRVEVTDGVNYKVVDRTGASVPSQKISEGAKGCVLFMAQDVPGIGYKIFFLDADEGLAEGKQDRVQVSHTKNAIVLENALVKVAVDERRGVIVSLVDKASGRELIDGSANKLLAFYDRAERHRAWNINPDYINNPIGLPEDADVGVATEGPLFAEVIAHKKFEYEGKLTTFSQKVRLVSSDPVVYLTLDSDFHIENSLVKLAFNTTLDSETISADGPYLVIERPTRPETAFEKARWEMACQKWIDISESDIGLALLNNGKYGFSMNDSGKGYRLSVIKGAEYPQAYEDAENVVHYDKKELPYTDQGAHHVELGLLAHKGGWREARLWEAGYNFNNPLEVVRTQAHKGELPPEGSFISIESDSVYIGSLKRAEDDSDLVIRLVEAAGKDATARVKLGLGLSASSVIETDLLELDTISGFHSKVLSFTIPMAPYQIKTIKVDVGR